MKYDADQPTVSEICAPYRNRDKRPPNDRSRKEKCAPRIDPRDEYSRDKHNQR